MVERAGARRLEPFAGLLLAQLSAALTHIRSPVKLTALAATRVPFLYPTLATL